MDHKHLFHLIAAVDQGQMQRAAEIAGVSPQAISKSIARLEQSVGGTLLQRTAKGVFPTPLANRLLPHARLVVAEMTMFQRVSDAELAKGKGRLTIGISPVAASSWIMTVLNGFLGQYSRLQLEILSGIDGSFREEIMAGRMDVAFAVDLNIVQDEERFLMTTECGEENWVVVGRAGHPSLGTARSLADLGGASWVVGRNAAVVDRLVSKEFRNAGLTVPHPKVSTTSLEATHGLLVGSDLLSILPASLVAKWSGVQGVDLASGRWKAPLRMFRRRRMAGDPLLDKLVAAVMAADPA
jgi:LysR family transcriptional regulator of abg operon